MTEKEYQQRLNHAANEADFRVGMVAMIVVVGIVVYQIWEMFQ
jgi:hypothetical protein